jgi:hypothetical protein
MFKMGLEEPWSPEDQEEAVRLMEKVHKLLGARQGGQNSSQEEIRHALVQAIQRTKHLILSMLFFLLLRPRAKIAR